jgi:hypothetical protein
VRGDGEHDVLTIDTVFVVTEDLAQEWEISDPEQTGDSLSRFFTD